jgi:hypothetical protein
MPAITFTVKLTCHFTIFPEHLTIGPSARKYSQRIDEAAVVVALIYITQPIFLNNILSINYNILLLQEITLRLL